MGLKEACDKSACEKAIKGIGSALTGETTTIGCDLLSHVYNTTQAGRYVGSRTELIQSSAYLMNLVSMGIEVQATYRSLKGKRDLWRNVANEYVGTGPLMVN